MEPRLKSQMAWIVRTKVKVLLYFCGITLATIGTISLGGLPWLPVVGFAVAAAAVSFSRATERLLRPTCLSCGGDLSAEPAGAHGVACRGCGSINHPSRQALS